MSIPARGSAIARAALTLALLVVAAAAPDGRLAAQRSQRASAIDSTALALTWLSITNWLVEAGDTRVLLDGYLTRIDRRTVEDDGTSWRRAVSDTAELRRRLRRAIPDLRLDWILVGHGHWDHAFDVPAIALMTGARIAGSRTVCLQAAALGVPPGRCFVVEGGEALTLGDGVRARVVRWHHSGDPATEAGRRLSAPLELASVPTPDPYMGGLRPGFLEDYPNGGGARAYLITADRDTAATTVLWSNSGNPAAWDIALRADTAALRAAGVDLFNLVPADDPRPTRDHLAAALRAEGLDSVDVWIGFPGPAHVRQVVPALRPATFIPHHWDDFWRSMGHGAGEPFSGEEIRPFLDSAGVRLLVPAAYYHRFQPTRIRENRAFEAGVEAGRALADGTARTGDMARFLAAGVGGFIAAPTLLFRSPVALAGIGLIGLAAHTGSDLPPPEHAAAAFDGGPDFSAGFRKGYAETMRRKRRSAVWGGAGVGAVGGLLFLLMILSQGYT